MSTRKPHGKGPETDRDYYRRRLSTYGRKAFEVVASALLFYLADVTVHMLLAGLRISEQAEPGKIVHQAINWAVASAYLIYVVRLLLPDASEQLAETRDQIQEHWKKPTQPRKKP